MSLLEDGHYIVARPGILCGSEIVLYMYEKAETLATSLSGVAEGWDIISTLMCVLKALPPEEALHTS